MIFSYFQANFKSLRIENIQNIQLNRNYIISNEKRNQILNMGITLTKYKHIQLIKKYWFHYFQSHLCSIQSYINFLPQFQTFNSVDYIFIIKMCQIYALQKRPSPRSVQKYRFYNQSINPDDYGLQSLNKNTISLHSRIKSLRRTELSSEKQNNKNKKTNSKESYETSIKNRSKESDNYYENTQKKKYQNQTKLKHRTVKKINSYNFIETFEKKLSSKQRVYSNEKIDQYFISFMPIENKKILSKPLIQKKLEDKAIESYKQMCSKKFLIDPQSKKKDIEYFLKHSNKKKSFLTSIESSVKQQQEQSVKDHKNKYETSIILGNENQQESLVSLENDSKVQLIQSNHLVRIVSKEQYLQAKKEVIFSQENIKNRLTRQSQNQNQVNSVNTSNFLSVQSGIGNNKKKNWKTNNSRLAGSRTSAKLRHMNSNNRQQLQSLYSQNSIEDIVQRIELHIEIIDTMAEFVVETQQLHGVGNKFKYGCFLIYKKFFMQRLNIQNSLYGNMNCFFLKQISIQTEILLKFYDTVEIQEILDIIQQQNLDIQESFQETYRGQFDTSVSGVDNKQLTKQIILEVYREYDFLSELKKKAKNKVNLIQKRMIKIIKLTFLLEELQHNLLKSYFQYESIQQANKFFVQFSGQYKKVLVKYNKNNN